jgi:hypothetical protein
MNLQADLLIQSRLEVFAKPGVLSVRAGWEFSSKGMTAKRVIVVTGRLDAQSISPALPTKLGETMVVYRRATFLQQLRSSKPSEYALSVATRPELSLPRFDSEVFFDRQGRSMPLGADIIAAKPAKPQVPYLAAPGVSLDETTQEATVELNVSPDAGWVALSAFLSATTTDLTVGMYDFTSAHVLAAVQKALKSRGQMTLTLDHPAPNPTLDQTDEQTHAQLSHTLGKRLDAAWALTDPDPFATAWIYPTAYHIKVAVRDAQTIWLSSGNWNNSNQPIIDLTDVSAAQKIAAKSDRDWHVIVSNTHLATTFRKVLAHDRAIAIAHNTTAATKSAEPRAEVLGLFAMQGRMPPRFFSPKTITGKIRLQPLLTPDNYHVLVKALIDSARTTFYMQTQYVHPSDAPADKDHAALIAAVKGRIDHGVDVRLITSQYQTNEWVEKLLDAGIPLSVLRRQANVHNKGIIVDGRAVMISSQNWSADGTLRNRDAGLVIHNANAAAYYQEIFLHDWTHLATAVTGVPSSPI